MVKSSAKTLEVRAEARIDGFLRGALELSWGRARALVEGGKVFVDGERVLEASAELRAGQTVEIRESAPRPRPNVPSDLIVFADAHVVVVRKPAGVSTVPYEEKERGTLDQLAARAVGQGPASLGVVHRLDKETSGLVVFTRTWLAKKSLSAQFRAHTVERRYLAIAHGEVPKKTIVTHLVADRGDGLRGSIEKMRSPPRNLEGQRAVTHVEPIETRRIQNVVATLVSCRLETGRTHQIRVHLSELGHPIVGERVYVREYRGPRIVAPRVDGSAAGGTSQLRLMLHATVLGFEHPKTGRHVRWEEPPPADFLALWPTPKTT